MNIRKMLGAVVVAATLAFATATPAFADPEIHNVPFEGGRFVVMHNYNFHMDGSASATVVLLCLDNQECTPVDAAFAQSSGLLSSILNGSAAAALRRPDRSNNSVFGYSSSYSNAEGGEGGNGLGVADGVGIIIDEDDSDEDGGKG